MPSPGIKLSSLSDAFRWNPKAGSTGRYIDQRGRFVKRQTIINDLERVTIGAKAEMVKLSEQLQSGTISLSDWQTGIRDRIKAIHNAQASIAKGGWAQMSQSDWGAVGQITKKQYAFLQNFAIELESGKQPLDGRFLRRVGMYADASRGTNQAMERREAINRDYTEERRIRHASDSCPTCIDQEDLGWQPIGTLNQIGDSECLTNCKCVFEYR